MNFKDLKTTTVICLCTTAKFANRSTAKKKKKNKEKSDRFKFSISCDAKGEQASRVGSLRKLERRRRRQATCYRDSPVSTRKRSQRMGSKEHCRWRKKRKKTEFG